MDLNKGNIKKILGIIVFTALLYVGLQKLNLVIGFLLSVLSLIFPFILGAAIAFILNVPMRGIEKLLFSWVGEKEPGARKTKPGRFHKLNSGKLIPKKLDLSKLKRHQPETEKVSVMLKLKRPISLVLTLILVIGLIMLVSRLVFPEIGRTFVLVQDQLPSFGKRMVEKSNELIAQYPDIADFISGYTLDWEQIAGKVFDFIQSSVGVMLKSTFSMASSILGGMIDFFVGFIFAIYLLIQKEKLEKQSKKLMYAYLPERVADKIIRISSLSAKTFTKFLSGQCMEALILGTIFFIVMSIFRFPYALMISVLIAFTALIPVFGAFIGCFIGAFLILIVNPVMALWFIILFIILQQLEGNLIYPHVVGSSVGLPSMWVLVAVTIGGSMMGVAGMLIFIPMTSVLYSLLREEMNKRIQERGIPEDKYK